jgi:hypothetical protein
MAKREVVFEDGPKQRVRVGPCPMVDRWYIKSEYVDLKFPGEMTISIEGLRKLRAAIDEVLGDADVKV